MPMGLDGCLYCMFSSASSRCNAKSDPEIPRSYRPNGFASSPADVGATILAACPDKFFRESEQTDELQIF